MRRNRKQNLETDSGPFARRRSDPGNFWVSVSLLSSTRRAASRSMGNLTPGQFISFFSAMMLMLQPIRRITNVNATLQRGVAGADSLFGCHRRGCGNRHGRTRIRSRKTASSSSGKYRFRTAATTRSYLTAFLRESTRAGRLPLLDIPAAASRRSRACCRAFMKSTLARSCSTAAPSASTRFPACGITSAW